jgi:hypothetical protein
MTEIPPELEPMAVADADPLGSGVVSTMSPTLGWSSTVVIGFSEVHPQLTRATAAGMSK